jgi:hypothetical protein
LKIKKQKKSQKKCKKGVCCKEEETQKKEKKIEIKQNPRDLVEPAQNSWVWFLKNNRHPHEPMQEAGNRLKERWQSMSIDEKKTYKDMSKKDAKRYLRDVQNLNLDERHFFETHKKQKRQKTRETCPKMSGYAMYVKINRPVFAKKNTDLPQTEIIRLLAQTWKSLNPFEKHEYDQKAKEYKQHALATGNWHWKGKKESKE